MFKSLTKKEVTQIIILSIVVLTVCAIAVVASIYNNPNRDVKEMVEERVKDDLLSPGTAKFSSMKDTEIKVNEFGDYTVSGWVDAENGFGATIRYRYDAEISNWGDGNLEITDYELHDPLDNGFDW